MNNRLRFFRPRFTLAALLLLITVVAIPLSYVAQRRAWNLRRKAAYEALVFKGFNFQHGISLRSSKTPKSTTWTRWLDTLLLDNLVPPVREVAIHDRKLIDEKVNDEDLFRLALFPEIKKLEINQALEITDRGLEVLEQLPELKVLTISRSPKVTSKLLEWIPPLEALSLDVQFDPVHIPALQKQPNLVGLGLRNAPLTDKDLSFLGDYEHLGSLKLEGMPITGAFLTKLNSKAPLWNLAIRAAPLKDQNAIELRQFSRLVHLDLAWTTLEGDFLPEAGVWPRLQQVDLQGVRFSDAGKRKLAQLQTPVNVTYPSNWSATDFGLYDASKVLPMINLNRQYAEEAKKNSVMLSSRLPPNFYWPHFDPPKIDKCPKESMLGVIRLFELAKAEEEELKLRESRHDGNP